MDQKLRKQTESTIKPLMEISFRWIFIRTCVVYEMKEALKIRSSKYLERTWQQIVDTFGWHFIWILMSFCSVHVSLGCLLDVKIQYIFQIFFVKVTQYEYSWVNNALMTIVLVKKFVANILFVAFVWIEFESFSMDDHQMCLLGSNLSSRSLKSLKSFQPLISP